MADLSNKISLDSSGFGQGVAEVREKLNELNTALINNKAAMKEANNEARELQKRQKELADAMKDGGTAEQRAEMQQLSERMAQVNARIAQLKTNEQELKSDVKKATESLTEQKQVTDATANATQQLSSQADTARNALNQLGGVIKGVIALAAGRQIYEGLIASNAEMEQYMTSFNVMLGDMEKAQGLMDKLTDMAAKTPMELTDVTSIGTLLMNYGVGVDDLISKMTQLGDLAGGNAFKFERVALAYGQMLAKGKVSGEELRQMTEAGVPLLQALADHLNMSAGEVQKMVSQSKVSIDDLDATIAELTAGTGQFAGMMEQQSQTFSGMISTINDNLAQFGRDAGAEVFEVVKQSLKDVLDLLNRWQEDGTLKNIAKDIGKVAADVATALSNVLKFVVENKEGFIALATAIVTFKTAMTVGNAINSVITAFIKLKTALQEGASAMDAVKAAFSINPYVLLASAIAAVVAGIAIYASQAETAAERTARLASETAAAADAAKAASTEQKNLSNIVEEYNNINDKITDTTEKKEKLTEVQEKLNALFGDEETGIDLVNGKYEEQIELLNQLSEIEKTRKINEVQGQLDESEKAIQEALNSTFEVTIDNTKVTDAVNKAFVDGIQKKYGKEVVSVSVDGGIRLEGDIETQIAALQDLQQMFIDTGTATTDFADAFDSVTNQLEALTKLKNGHDELKQALAELNGEAAVTDTLIKGLGASDTRLDEVVKPLVEDHKEFSKSMDSAIANSEALKSAIDKLNSGESLSYSEMRKIVGISPELVNAVETRTDGYYIEVDALAELNDSYTESSKAKIQEEIDKTQAAIDGSRERIKIYEREAAIYGQAGDVEAVNRRRQLIADTEAQITEAEAEIADLQSQILGFDYSGSTGKKTGKDKNEQDFENARKELKYELDMGEIDKEQYYTKLGQLRDKYLKEDSDAWRSAALEIKKYNDGKGETSYNEQKKELKYQLDMGDIGEDEYYSKLEQLRDTYLKKNSDAWKSATVEINKYRLKTEKELLDESAKQYSDYVNDKVKQIDRELAAKEKLKDETLAAIDAEVKARKRLTEDNDIQKQIDSVMAQLNYAQLDEFSRRQLERQLSNLQEQQANKAWERNVDDRKETVNNEYSAAQKEATEQKQALKDASATVKEIMTELKNGMQNIVNIVNNAITNNNTTNNNTANIKFDNADNMTKEQIIAIVNDYYGVTNL